MQNKKIHIEIVKGTIEDATNFFGGIPEFTFPYSQDEYKNRLDSVPHLILNAKVDLTIAGMKIGYERLGNFYSWVGAVIPEYRGTGVASALSDYQEAWAKYNQYQTIFMKTRVRFGSMLAMNLKRGYQIIGFEEKDDFVESRIIMRKEL